MNLQQKFLLLFADYRDMRDENSRLSDELLQLREQVQDERRRFDALQQRYIDREEQWNDRLLGARFPIRSESPRKPSEKPTEKALAEKKEAFRQQLMARYRELT